MQLLINKPEEPVELEAVSREQTVLNIIRPWTITGGAE